MLIVRNSLSQVEKGATVSREAGQWVLKFDGIEKPFVFVDAAVNFNPDFAHLVYGNDGFCLIWSSEVNESKSGLANALHRKHVFKLQQLASFYIDTKGEVHCFIRNRAVQYSGTDMVVDQANGAYSSEDIFAKYVPEAAQTAKRLAAKQVLLGHIKPEDALAMLEAQLDLLTLAFLGDGSAKQALSEAVAGSTVTTIHPMEKLKQTISRQKGHIRSEQLKYFQSRGEDAINGDLSS